MIRENFSRVGEMISKSMGTYACTKSMVRPTWIYLSGYSHQKIDHPSPSRLPEFREPAREPSRDDRACI